MRAIRLELLMALLLLGAACATGTTDDATNEGAGSDWTAMADGGADDGCFPGEHLCDGTCVPDQVNDPELGCELGCGTPCEAPDGATASCGLDGRCSFECDAPFERAGDSCECAPLSCGDPGAECGEVDDGCGGTLDCGACEGGTGSGGTGACAPDEAEDNEVQAHAHELGDLTDRPRTDMVVDTFALHSQTDVDWYRATIVDAFGDGNPTMEITLADAAPGYVVGAWFVCDSGGDDTSCEVGTSDNRAGRGCVATTGGTGATTLKLQSSCSGWDESGVLVIRIMAETDIEACIPYTLGLSVD